MGLAVGDHGFVGNDAVLREERVCNVRFQTQRIVAIHQVEPIEMHRAGDVPGTVGGATPADGRTSFERTSQITCSGSLIAASTSSSSATGAMSSATDAARRRLATGPVSVASPAREPGWEAAVQVGDASVADHVERPDEPPAQPPPSSS